MAKRLLRAFFAIPLLFSVDSIAQVVPLDVSGVRPGPVVVERSGDTLLVRWPDEASRPWTAEFSLDPAKALITTIRMGDKTIAERARPLYWCETGKRRGGWDAFFDRPFTHPEGTRRSVGEFLPLAGVWTKGRLRREPLQYRLWTKTEDCRRIKRREQT